MSASASPASAQALPDLRLAFYGDDFTGSTDALEFLVRAGVRTMLFIEPPTPKRLAAHGDLQAVGVAGMTRSMPPEAMEKELRPAFAALRKLGAPHVHYKVCSTFDSSPTIGSIGRAIDVGAEIFGAQFVPLLVGAPALGRHCVFGNLFAKMGIGTAGAIHRLDRHPAMSRHPITPADESDLRVHLARQTEKRIGLFDILDVELPFEAARARLEDIVREKSEIVLFDALYAGQLLRIGALIDASAERDRPLFSVGSSGVEMGLTAHWTSQGQLQPRTAWSAAGAIDPLLVVSGSCSPVTERQIAWALAHGYAEVPLDTGALAQGRGADTVVTGAVETAIRQLGNKRSVVVHSSRGDADPRLAATAAALVQSGLDAASTRAETARLIGTALGRVVHEAVAHAGVRRVVIAGGDTSSYAARAMGIQAVEVIIPLAPGVPLLRAHAPGTALDGLEVNFKGGQVGQENYFDLVAQGKALQ